MKENLARKGKDEDESSELDPNGCCGPEGCAPSMNRRHFVKVAGLGTALAAGLEARNAAASARLRQSGNPFESGVELDTDSDWPVLKRYDQDHLARIALPLGGIGTGTVSLGGRGDWRDWEIMNRPAKGFVPSSGRSKPSVVLFVRRESGPSICRVVEGPLESTDFENSHGSTATNVHLPRFRHCSFAAAYPFGRVTLSDPDVPLAVEIEAFNPLVPGDAEASGVPTAILTYHFHNRTGQPLTASVCANLPNFIGIDGWQTTRDWKGDPVATGADRNRNRFRDGGNARGIFLFSEGVDSAAEQWGTLALATTATSGITYRTTWQARRWGSSILDFWEDFSADGELEEREPWDTATPMASLAVRFEIPAYDSHEVTFLLTWHFPNRYTWTPQEDSDRSADWIGNYYTTRYEDAWDVVEKTVARLSELKAKTVEFVSNLCSSSLPEEVKEAALFNLSTLRTQTCFRTPDGRFFGWEGAGNQKGCCHGSCTHVWNYEQATAFLFGELARSMREVEFGHATDKQGLMSFRVNLPLSRSQDFSKAAADGQMGCIMKMYRDWQLSGDDQELRQLWPQVRKALEFCWIPGGWDADRDGVMEGCQHNTMDVEYYGPNPQMGIWYLGALRAAEEMARYLDEREFAETCRRLFEQGKQWIDQHLFNGEYYEHQIRPPRDESEIAPSLRVGMGARDVTQPDYQLGSGCLVDQLVGQFAAHVCGLGYLLEAEHVRKTLQSVLKYNHRASLHAHFNCLRTFALGTESALLMASYPKGRPKNPFPYFTEVMTGFEYTAAVGMLYEGLLEEGLGVIRDIRERYDGLKRNPFDEAECGHHYARAMASWAAVLALSGFHYSGVEKKMTFSAQEGTFFWSNGSAWGNCILVREEDSFQVDLSVHSGDLTLAHFDLDGFGKHGFEATQDLSAGDRIAFRVRSL